MTQKENIEYLRNDISNALTNAFTNRVRQIAPNNPELISIYKEQFVCFIRQTEKQTGKIYGFLKNQFVKGTDFKIVGHTQNFTFRYIIKEDKSSGFEIQYIQRTTTKFDSKFLINKIKETYGYVYILESEYGYKIGCSSQLSKRLDHFNVLLPFKYDVHSVIKTTDYENLEKILHKLLKNKRLNGEWFKLEKSDFEEMDLLLKNLQLRREKHGS